MIFLCLLPRSPGTTTRLASQRTAPGCNMQQHRSSRLAHVSPTHERRDVCRSGYQSSETATISKAQGLSLLSGVLSTARSATAAPYSRSSYQSSEIVTISKAQGLTLLSGVLYTARSATAAPSPTATHKKTSHEFELRPPSKPSEARRARWHCTSRSATAVPHRKQAKYMWQPGDRVKFACNIF